MSAFEVLQIGECGIESEILSAERLVCKIVSFTSQAQKGRESIPRMTCRDASQIGLMKLVIG